MSNSTSRIQLKKEDYVNLEHVLVMINTTSGTSVLNPHQLELLEYSGSRLLLRVPKNACAVGHSLALYVAPKSQAATLPELVKLQKTEGLLAMTAKVKEVTITSPNWMEVHVSLLQVMDKEWREFLKAYSDVQEQVDKVIRSIKE